MNKLLVVANWKMNPVTLHEAEELLRAIQKEIQGKQNVEVVLCPPFIYLSALVRLSSEALSVGGQNCFWEQKGPYTGEISPLMLRDIGCKYVIVGHSERKQYFAETDEIINKKVKAALKAGLNVVLCIGEAARDSFDSGGKWTHELDIHLKDQLVGALKDVRGRELARVVVAYEPIWAIGTGKAAVPDDVLSVKIFIRKILSGLYGRKKADSVRVLYGGSTNRKNAADFIVQGQADGLLVGGGSLDAQEFIAMVQEIYESSAKHSN